MATNPGTATTIVQGDDSSKYATPLELAQHLYIVKYVPDISTPGQDRTVETVGTGTGTANIFYLDHSSIIAGTYVIYFGADTDNLSILVEDTEYELNLTTGQITLTEEGISTLGTDNIYAEYAYISVEGCEGQITNEMLRDALDRACDDIDDTTHNHWTDGTEDTPTYNQVTNETHDGKGSTDTQYYLRRFPIPNVSTTVTVAASIGATSISVDSTNGFLSSGTVLIDNNKVSYTGKTSTTFTGVTGITTALTTDSIVYPFVIEIATDLSGSAPTWEILSKDTDFDINLVTGRVTILKDQLVSDTYYSDVQPPRFVPNRLRATFIYGNSTIPNDIKRLTLMIAAKELANANVTKNILGGLTELSPGVTTVNDAWIERKLKQYSIYFSSNV